MKIVLDETSRKEAVRRRLWREAVIGFRFGIVGGIATVVHILIVAFLLSNTPLPTLAANTLAFLSAFGVSFTGNYLWTFGSPGHPRRAMRRFLLISCSAFAVNTLILATILRAGWLAPLYAAILSAAVIPAITFLASRLWGFQNGSRETGYRDLFNENSLIKKAYCIKNYCLKEYSMLAAIPPVTIGGVSFLLVVGPRVLDPANLAWLAEGDPATHYLGWLFFRNTGWSFPIGLNPDYGLEIGSAIIFSDSNPLLAFLFKPFAALLPEPFQYFGIWILACFVLQAWFGWKLVALISDSLAIRALGAAFFVFAPPMIWRLHGHLSLVGHFLVVAALYLALDRTLLRRKLAWGMLLAVAALVHVYLLAMVALLWLADMLGKIIEKNLSIQKAVVEFATILSVIGIISWQVGYLSVGSGVSAGGYGLYRMNLLSIIDSSGWSYVLKDISEGQGDYEGFNFLGLGVIFLLVSALPALFAGKIGILRAASKFPVILLALAGLTVFAISHKVGFESYEFEYSLPDQALSSANILRASGRMFWPVFYMILFVAIFCVVRGYQKRVAASLLGLALVIQIVDTSAGWTGIRSKLMAEPSGTWSTPLADPFWDDAAAKYAKVRWIQPGNHTPQWLTLAAYAGTHGLATDAVYLARVGNAALGIAQGKATEALATGRYEPDSLYVLDDGALRQAAFSISADNDLLARIDGFNVLAPGWKKCTACPRVVNEVKASDLLPSLAVGERMLTNASGAGLAYLAEGWSHPEPWGIWSDGPKATIALPASSERGTSVLIEANPLLGPTHPKQDVEVLVNGVPAAKATLTADSKQEFEVQIPKSALEEPGADQLIKLEFRFPDAARPKDIGINEDTRMLAIGLLSLTVR
jgi:putative flippase GtrA